MFTIIGWILFIMFAIVSLTTLYTAVEENSGQEILSFVFFMTCVLWIYKALSIT